VIELISANSVDANEEMIAVIKAKFPKLTFKGPPAARYLSQTREGLLMSTPNHIPGPANKKIKGRELTEWNIAPNAGFIAIQLYLSLSFPEVRST
jgi:hypothetical protein